MPATGYGFVATCQGFLATVPCSPVFIISRCFLSFCLIKEGIKREMLRNNEPQFYFYGLFDMPQIVLSARRLCVVPVFTLKDRICLSGRLYQDPCFQRYR
ncbi:hypothetical protein GV64_11060 [Endozoicomonas elysicola]|uniref:Uncharacterized protein n=1 Tax=Endozoicomonas elysicola TaxID=305900 RepID=A0A081KAN3_9GAMM|nr:hypothetical protein GV64_11060 [Endozoicomonas elysicola]